MAKSRIAIIGGGPSGLSAAYHLSRTAELRAAYEVTVYQLGWRLGGKGATGRDETRNWRIEEHGIHGFCGFYWNSLRMMKDCYETMYPTWSVGGGQKLPLTMDEAFLGSSWAASPEQIDGVWHESGRWLMSQGAPIWERPDAWPELLTPQAALRGLIHQLLQRGRKPDAGAVDSSDLHVGESTHDDHAGLFHRAVHAIASGFEKLVESELLRLANEALELGTKLLGKLQRATGERSPDLYNTLTNLDFLLALLRGLLEPDEDGTPLLFREFDAIDHLDYRDWLRANGASDMTLDAAAIEPPAFILFPAPDGDTFRTPTLSASVYAAWIVRNLCVAGDTFYFFAAGTGETVIRPAYEALVERGVQFEFFHKLDSVALDDSGPTPSLRALNFTVQARTKTGDPYDPLVHVFGKADSFRVWPNHPVYEQLADADDLRGIDLESWWAPVPASATSRVLERGAPDGFDAVVWAIPPPTLRYSGAELIGERGSPAFVAAASMASTPTMEYQIWTTVPTSGTDDRAPDGTATSLGWPVLNPVGSGTHHRYASATYPMPLDGVTDFSDLMDYEVWPDEGPKGLVYFCGQLEDIEIKQDPELADPTMPARALARAWGEVLQTQRDLGEVIPAARIAPNQRLDPRLFDPQLLWAPEGMVGNERVLYQYVKANIDPPERYMQGPPSTATLRMMPWATGVDGLVAAGDWVYTGFNSGCFEGAVIGGALAAFAISGEGKPSTIPGFTFLHPDATRDADSAVPLVPLAAALAQSRG